MTRRVTSQLRRSLASFRGTAFQDTAFQGTATANDGSDESCGFWTEGADEYVNELDKEHNARLDELHRQQQAASSAEDLAEIEEALQHAHDFHKQKLAEVPKLLF